MIEDRLATAEGTDPQPTVETPDFGEQWAFLQVELPGLRREDVRFNDDGFHNVIAVVEKRLIYRFARYDWSCDLLEKEIVKLDLLRDRIDMPIPNMELLRRGIGRYDYIPGTALYRHHLLSIPPGDQDHVAEQLADYLRQLQAIPLDEVRRRGIWTFPGTATRESVLAAYEDMRARLYPHMMQYDRSYVDQIFDTALADPAFFDFTPTFVHGDLDAYHMCYDPARHHINGMIDYGVAGIGNPSHDVMVLIDYFGETFMRRVGKYYDLAPLIRQARFGAFLTGVYRALRALDTGDMMWHLGFHLARDVMPIDCEWGVTGSSTSKTHQETIGGI